MVSIVQNHIFFLEGGSKGGLWQVQQFRRKEGLKQLEKGMCVLGPFY